MKKARQSIFIFLLIISLGVTACSSGASKPASQVTGETCAEGVCANIIVEQPVVLNQPSMIIIRVHSKTNYPNLLVKLQATPSNVSFGEPSYWKYNAEANLSQEFRSTIILREEGEYGIDVVVFVENGARWSRFFDTKMG
jgi:uncharacterized membrane protein